jgi:FAD/FMN-containing dehydrogenase
LPHGFWFPVDLGADPQIGGMVATNTGGTRLLKYGDVRHNLLGVEVVLGDGRVLSALNRLRKNNTGLDAKHLFVGTSGVFGIVTRAVLQVAPLPRNARWRWSAATSGDCRAELLRTLERDLGDVLSAFEVMSAARSGRCSRTSRTCGGRSRSCRLQRARRTVVDAAVGAIVARRCARRAARCAPRSRGRRSARRASWHRGEEFWQMRHHISESLRSEGKMLAFDVSVPRSQLPAFTEAVHTMLAAEFPVVRLCDYGHWGDGGTHLNLVWDESKAIGVPGGASWSPRCSRASTTSPCATSRAAIRPNTASARTTSGSTTSTPTRT